MHFVRVAAQNGPDCLDTVIHVCIIVHMILAVAFGLSGGHPRHTILHGCHIGNQPFVLCKVDRHERFGESARIRKLHKIYAGLLYVVIHNVASCIKIVYYYTVPYRIVLCSAM